MTATETYGWERLTGQERAVELLQRAAERPVHAYLLVGPRGSGVEDAARCFAAALVAPDGDTRTWDLVGRGMHPDVVEFEPEGGTYRIKDDVRDRIIPEASRSPIESERKVVILFEADRLKGTRNDSANTLLKTLEEPPPRTVMVLVTAFPDELLETVRSRCQRVDLAPLAEDVVRTALEREGVAEADARLAARLSGGQLGRARTLAGPGRAVRDAFVTAAARLDGTAGSAERATDDVVGALADAVAGLEARQAREVEDLEAEIERAGYAERAGNALTRRLAERHKRQHRAARRDAIDEGLAALETVYLDALAGPGAPARNLDRPPLKLDRRACTRALDACREARAAFEFNPNETLLLERLMLHLPAAATAGTPQGGAGGGR
jgi:DNA polymerase-3 subunit delta'